MAIQAKSALSPVTGAGLLVKSLEARGVEYVFGLPGAKIDAPGSVPEVVANASGLTGLPGSLRSPWRQAGGTAWAHHVRR